MTSINQDSTTQEYSAEKDLENTMASQAAPEEYSKPVFSDSLSEMRIESSMN